MEEKKKRKKNRVSEGFGPITRGFPLPSANQGLDAFLHFQSETTPLKTPANGHKKPTVTTPQRAALISQV